MSQYGAEHRESKTKEHILGIARSMRESGQETVLITRIDEETASLVDMTFNILMGDKVEPRREFIEANAQFVKNLDV